MRGTMKKGKLFIVPTPIGNLGDMTFRSVETLKKVAIIGAEDTRTSAPLLKHFAISAPMFSYHKFNERSRVEKVLEHLKNGEDVAIISDAGTPGISDPAAILVQAVLQADFVVETLPGASALLPALVSSGLNCDRFFFAGFLPEKESEREKLLSNIGNLPDSLVFYEAPHRIFKTCQILLESLGNRRVVLAREISKLHETFYRSSLKEILSQPEMIMLKGEFVIILEGAAEKEYSDQEIIELLKKALSEGKTKKTAAGMLAREIGVNKNRIYDLALKLENN